MTARRSATSRSRYAYAAREFAEVAILAAILAIVASFVRVPTWLFLGLPLTKALASAIYYILVLRKAFRRPPRGGAEDLIGRVAQAVTPLRPEGQIKLDGEIWGARSVERESIDRYSDVEIVEVTGNTALVTRAHSPRRPTEARQREDWISNEDR